MISWFLFILQTTTTGKLNHSFQKWFYFIFRCGIYILDLLFLRGEFHLKGQKVKKFLSTEIIFRLYEYTYIYT